MKENIYNMQKELVEMYKPDNIIGLSKTEARKVLNDVESVIRLSKNYNLTNTKEYKQLSKVYKHLKSYTNNGRKNNGYRKNDIEKVLIEESKRKYELIENLLLQMYNKDKEMVQLVLDELAKYINKDFKYKENLEALLNNILNNDSLDQETKQRLASNIIEIIKYITVSNSNVKPDVVNNLPLSNAYDMAKSKTRVTPTQTPESITPTETKPEIREENGKNGNRNSHEREEENSGKKTDEEDEGCIDKFKRFYGWLKGNVGKPFEKPPFNIGGIYYNPEK